MGQNLCLIGVFRDFSLFDLGVPDMKPFDSPPPPPPPPPPSPPPPPAAVGVMYLRTGRLQGGGCASMSKSGTVCGELRELS